MHKPTSNIGNRKLYEQGHIVRLIIGIQRRLISAYFPAFRTAMHYNEALFGIRLGTYRLKLSAAGIGSVPGVYIHVQGPEAERAVVTRRISERLYLLSAMNAGKGCVVL